MIGLYRGQVRGNLLFSTPDWPLNGPSKPDETGGEPDTEDLRSGRPSDRPSLRLPAQHFVVFLDIEARRPYTEVTSIVLAP